MAFPTLVGQATWNTGSAATSHKAVITATTVHAGDLIVVWWTAASGAGAPTVDPKWTVLINVGNGARALVVYAIADGTETGATLTLATVASSLGMSNSRVYTAGTFGAMPKAASHNDTSTANPDPPNLAPGWSNQDIEWLAANHGNNNGTTFSTDPTNYTVQANLTPRAGCTLNIGNRTLNAASEDPGTFAFTGGTQSSVTTTVAVPGKLTVSLGGGLTPAGALTKQAAFHLAGGLTPAGALAKQAKKPLAGALTPSATLVATKLAALALAGGLTPSGALTKSARKPLAGALTPAGALTKKANKTLSGGLTPSGTLGLLRNLLLGGSLTPHGTLTIVAVVPIFYKRGRRLIQYHAFLLSQDSNGGPFKLIGDITPEILNLTWQRSMNLSGTAAFTLPRNSSKIGLILPQQVHLAIWRERAQDGARLVWQGKIADYNPGPLDVVFRAIDYVGYLQRSRTGYKTLYPQKKVGSEIISPEWALAQSVDRSPLAFVATGTIEDPLGLDGVTKITTNKQYGLVDFDRLFTFFALAEMSMANTSNNVQFEITLSETAPTFNFWKNKSSNRTDPVLHFPGNLIAFNYAPGYANVVTDMASIINNSNGTQGEYVVTAASGLIDQYRRLQAAVAIESLMGLDATATETDQMKAAVQRLAANAVKLPRMFVALPRYDEVDPSNMAMGDNVLTFAQKAGSYDVDEVGDYLRIISMAASWRPDAGEQLQLWLRAK